MSHAARETVLTSQNLFHSVSDALRADFHSSNLPVIRAQYAAILRERVALLPHLYGLGKANGSSPAIPPAPRENTNFRLPPLQFDGGAHEEPRSLTPITERSDVASRNNSMRTANSTLRMGVERRHSDARQTSGGSSKPSAEERLAPISDTSEGFGPRTTEPVEDLSYQQSTPTTAESATAPTVWSQSSGVTPTASRQGSLLPIPVDAPAATRPVAAENVQRGDQNLPDLPAGAAASEPVSAPSDSAVLAPPIMHPATEPATASDVTVPPVSAQHVISQETNPEILSPTPRRDSSGGSSPTLLHNEPAAMYLMNMADEGQNGKDSSTLPVSSTLAPSTTSQNGQTPSPERVRPNNVTAPDGQEQKRSSTLEPLGRKPSGARAPPPKRGSTMSPRGLDSIEEPKSADNPPAVSAGATTGTSDTTPGVIPPPVEGQAQKTRNPSTVSETVLDEEAAHLIAFAEAPSSPVKPTVPLAQAPKPKPPVEQEEIRSSFAPSKAATERRARAEEQQRARALPGAGKRTAPQNTWSGSDEDEDEDEVDEFESPSVGNDRPQDTRAPPPDSSAPVAGLRALPPVPHINGNNGPQLHEPLEQSYRDSHHSTFAGVPERPMSRSPGVPNRQYTPPIQSSQTQPQPPASRQTIWNANFALDHGMNQNRSTKFIDMEEPSVQLTKAFAPQGLLQAGLQDKEERSAKRQEEFAREMGSSLVNVPSKPPPPQAGLLGAVAAHEKERQNAGGIGATLTDREREKRLAVSLQPQSRSDTDV